MKLALYGERLNKAYYKAGERISAVNNVTIKFVEGEFTAIHGASGAGKSTLLYLLGGLGKPDTGSVVIGDRNVNLFDKKQLFEMRRQKIGFVFQFLYLVPTFTALQNVMVPLFPLRIKKEDKMTMALRAIEQAGITHRIKHRPSEMSAGEQQRVGIARAIVNNPQIILADEPTSDLDRQNTESIITLLQSLNRAGCTVIISSHDNRILGKVKRRIEMEDGSILSDTN
jgi:ABC-type lipoprotein export system ATPase subunit